MVDLSFASVARSLAGGALIGASASILLRVNGRIAGISGMLVGMFERSAEASWRRLFLTGLLLGGVFFALASPSAVAVDARPSLVTTIIAGLLVGVGTTLGGGCTSGHGVCGISRLSLRSIVATFVFMATGFATVYLTRHVLSGAP